jgi:hypothetical protein
VNCKVVRTLRGARGEVNWVMSNTGHWLKLFCMSRRRCHDALRVDFFGRMRCSWCRVGVSRSALKERGKKGFEIALARQRQSGRREARLHVQGALVCFRLPSPSLFTYHATSTCIFLYLTDAGVTPRAMPHDCNFTNTADYGVPPSF